MQVIQSPGHAEQLLVVISNQVPERHLLMQLLLTMVTPSTLVQDVQEVGDSEQVAQIGLQNSHLPFIARNPSGHEAIHVLSKSKIEFGHDKQLIDPALSK